MQTSTHTLTHTHTHACAPAAAFLRQLHGPRFIAGVKYWFVLSTVLVSLLLLLDSYPRLIQLAPNFGYSAVAVGMSDRVESTMGKVWLLLCCLECCTKSWHYLLRISFFALLFFCMQRHNTRHSIAAAAAAASAAAAQVAVWVSSSILGAILGWALMAHHAVATSAPALATIIATVCFLAGSLPRSSYTLMTAYTLMTLSSVALCQ
jgi:hypothetical protein